MMNMQLKYGRESNPMSQTGGQWLGWMGMIAALLGFVIPHFLLGVTAMIFGLCGLRSEEKVLNTSALFLGFLALLLALF